MGEKKVFVFTGRDDPMWPFLLEECTGAEQKEIRLFQTDQPTHSAIEYDPVAQKGVVKIGDELIDPSCVTAVWYRRFVPPALSHLGVDLQAYCEREYADFFQGIEFAFRNALWVSLPSAIELARSKPRQLHLAHQIGFKIPNTEFTNWPMSLEKAVAFEEAVYKSIRSPRVPTNPDRHTSVFTTRLTDELIVNRDGIMTCPGIVQEFVPKKADIRISVFGSNAFAVRIDSQSTERSKVDFRNGARHLHHEIHLLPKQIEDQCIQLVRQLGLLYGAIDLALLEDESYVFFEINPNGQWGWLEKEVRLPMRRALLKLLFQDKTDPPKIS